MKRSTTSAVESGESRVAPWEDSGEPDSREGESEGDESSEGGHLGLEEEDPRCLLDVEALRVLTIEAI